MKVRELLKRLPTQPILLLQLGRNKTAMSLADAILSNKEHYIQIRMHLRESAYNVGFICIYAMEPNTVDRRLCVTMTMWDIFAKHTSILKSTWDVDIALKDIPLKEDREWLHRGGDYPKLPAKVYADVNSLANQIRDSITDIIIKNSITAMRQSERKVESQQKAIRKLNNKLDDWPTRYSLLEIENAQLRRDNQELAEYIAALQSIPEPESIPVEAVESRDLSGYKIKVCTTRESMKLFEWECFDVDAYPTAVENCVKCDLVIIDTGHISHHTFWTVRDYCKNRGIKCVYTSFHNKERLRALVWEALHK